MPNKRKPTTEMAIRQQEAEAEAIHRSGLLYRYLRVVDRRDDVLLIEPRPGHNLQLMFRVDAAGPRGMRIVVAPNAPGSHYGPVAIVTLKNRTQRPAAELFMECVRSVARQNCCDAH